MLIQMFSMHILSSKRFDEPLFNENRKFSCNRKYYQSVHSVFTVVTCIICKFLFYFLIGFVLFPDTLTVLGTW